MSDPSIHPMGLHIMLAEANANEWKDVLINKALMLNAYDVLMGTETLASVGMDETVVTNFKAHQLQLAGNIDSMLIMPYSGMQPPRLPQPMCMVSGTS